MGRYILFKTCWILTKCLLAGISPKTGKNELMNELTSMIPILSDNKALEYYNPKSEKVGTVWKTQIKKESSDF